MKLRLLEYHYKSVVAIVYDEHANILLGKATNNDDRKGKWCFPAGRIKPGEFPREATIRECFEETGLTVKPQQDAFPHHFKPHVGFVVCRKISGDLKPNGEFEKLKWVPWDRVINLKDLYPDIAEIMRKPIAGFP